MDSDMSKVCATKPRVDHAHLIAIEMSDQAVLEYSEAVMEEIEFRATHLSSLMLEMFQEAGKKDAFEIN